MPKKASKMKKRNNGARTFRQPRETPSNALSYTGPIVSPAAYEEADLHTVLLASTAILSSSAANIINNEYNNDPSGYHEWSSFATLFHEYRVLGMEIHFRPKDRYSKTTTLCNPLATVVDRSASGVLINYNVAASHASCKWQSLEDPWQRVIKMSNAEEAQFRQTASPAAYMWFKLWADTLSASTNYGMLIIKLLVQFRGRQ